MPHIPIVIIVILNLLSALLNCNNKATWWAIVMWTFVMAPHFSTSNLVLAISYTWHALVVLFLILDNIGQISYKLIGSPEIYECWIAHIFLKMYHFAKANSNFIISERFDGTYCVTINWLCYYLLKSLKIPQNLQKSPIIITLAYFQLQATQMINSAKFNQYQKVFIVHMCSNGVIQLKSHEISRNLQKSLSSHLRSKWHNSYSH